jgi:beta-N-acetylhexosaminidase
LFEEVPTVWVSRARRGLTLAALIALVACQSTVRSTTTTATATAVTEPRATSTVAATTSTVQPTTALPTTTTAPVSPLLQCVQAWPLRDRVALLVWPAIKSTQCPGGIAQHVGGVLLIPLMGFFAGLPATWQNWHLRLLSPTKRVGPSNAAAAGLAGGNSSVRSPRQALLACPVVDRRDVVLGPVVDVRPTSGSDPLGENRLFVGGPAEVAGWASVYVAAWQAAGLTPVLKHFPGHGSASGDTHDGRATTPSLDELRDRDLVPYRVLAGSGAAVMIGHLVVPGLTDGVPASLSAAAVALLRNELGWGDALVMTDALGMGGVGLSLTEAAVRAVSAGVDVVVFTGGDQTAAVIETLTAAVGAGTLDVARVDEAAARVAGVLAAHGHPCA